MYESQGRFIALLNQELTILKDIHDLLQEEYTALKQKKIDVVNNLNETKNTLLNQLGILDKQRQVYMENKDHELNVDSEFYSNVNRFSNEIENQLEQCKHQNNINGSLIEISLLFNNKMLDIFCGNIDKELTYGASGKNDGQATTNSLAHV